MSTKTTPSPTKDIPIMGLLLPLALIAIICSATNLYLLHSFKRTITYQQTENKNELAHYTQSQQSQINEINKKLRQQERQQPHIPSIWTKIYFAVDMAHLHMQFNHAPTHALSWLKQAKRLLMLMPEKHTIISNQLEQKTKLVRDLKPIQRQAAYQSLNQLQTALSQAWPQIKILKPKPHADQPVKSTNKLWQTTLQDKLSRLFIIHKTNKESTPWQPIHSQKQVLLTQASNLIDQMMLALESNQKGWFTQTMAQLDSLFATSLLKSVRPNWKQSKKSLKNLNLYNPTTIDFKPLLLAITKQGQLTSNIRMPLHPNAKKSMILTKPKIHAHNFIRAIS
jgi:hypothetical protein